MSRMVVLRRMLRRITLPAVRWMWTAPPAERVRRPRRRQVNAACLMCGREIVLICRRCCRDLMLSG